MSKILVVCDNEYLNLLYVLNLEVYLATETTLVTSLTDALEILKKKDQYHLLITLSQIGADPAFTVLDNFRKSYGKKIPMIVAGTLKDEELGENVYGVSEKFNLQSILKTSAKILGITAKQMAELDVGAFYPVPIRPLKNLLEAPCTIYKKSEKSFELFARTDDPIVDMFADLDSKQVDHLYVKSGDRLTIINKISLSIIDQISHAMKNMKEAPVDAKVNALNDGFEFAAANLFSNDEIKAQMQQLAMAGAELMKDVAKDAPNMKGLLAIMLSHRSGYIFTHSMITSYVAYHMIKNVSWGGEGQVEKINFVLFFHDIFLSPIYLKFPDLTRESELLDNDRLSEKEKDVVLNHAKLAAEMVVSYKRCPMGADVLIKQHHGMKKGKGFARIYMEDLSPLAKVILISEKFVEELIHLPPDKLSAAKAIIIPKLISEFKSPSYSKMAQTLVNVPV